MNWCLQPQPTEVGFSTTIFVVLFEFSPKILEGSGSNIMFPLVSVLIRKDGRETRPAPRRLPMYSPLCWQSWASVEAARIARTPITVASFMAELVLDIHFLSLV